MSYKKNRKMLLLSYVAIAVGGILFALGTLGQKYYRDKIESEKQKSAKDTLPAIQKNNIDNNLNSPITGKVENQTINYFQGEKKTDDTKQKKQNKAAPKLEDKKQEVVNITSNNQ